LNDDTRNDEPKNSESRNNESRNNEPRNAESRSFDNALSNFAPWRGALAQSPTAPRPIGCWCGECA
jgi:hypothetical protein